jgi:hypothetical protein
LPPRKEVFDYPHKKHTKKLAKLQGKRKAVRQSRKKATRDLQFLAAIVALITALVGVIATILK